MGVTPQSVVHHDLNLTGQNILTFGSWIITVCVLILAYRMGRKERTPFYIGMILAALVGAIAEPLYDVMFSLYFYSGPTMQTTYTAFGIPQPVWAYSGYAILYGLPAMYVVKRSSEGRLTANVLWIFAGIELLESCLFEIAGINLGTYTYWGPHQFRVAGYPLIIGILEAAQVMAFAVAAANLRHRKTARWQSIALFGIFPITMLGVNFGAGFPEILAIHLENADAWTVRAVTLVSVALAAAVIRLCVAMIPPQRSGADAATAPAADRSPVPDDSAISRRDAIARGN
jgi:hypothetical protein